MSRKETSPVLGRLSRGGFRNFADNLRAENAGAVLLLAGTVLALLCANSPAAGWYEALSNTVLGIGGIGLELTLAEWAMDGLLTIFFFVVGLELKREIVEGQLRRPATAIVPVVGAVGGMLAPALIYLLVVTLRGGDQVGWAIPVATDIAFAVAVLSVCGRGLPAALRAFLLTLAVADDLLGILVIALFYGGEIHLLWLVGSLVAVAGFGWLVRNRPTWWPVLVLLAVASWYLLHHSGVHATIAGVLLGFVVPGRTGTDGSPSRAEILEHRWRPVSAGLAVPLFAFFAAGVKIDPSSLGAVVVDPNSQGVILGLVLGKPLGITVATVLLVRLTRAQLDPTVKFPDLIAVSMVAGIGFTVALLIAQLSFAPGSAESSHVRTAVLIGSVLAAVLGGTALQLRGRQRGKRLPD